MANTDVKIKLSADGKQVRDQIKLIDRDLKQLGSDSSIRNSGNNQNANSSMRTPEQSSGDKTKQETRDKVDSDTLKELSLLRKELQKLNSKNKGIDGVGQNSPTPNSNPRNNLPSGNNTPSSPDSNRPLSESLGKLGSSIAALGMGLKMLQSIQGMAKGSQSGMSQAYRTYGSLMAYTDYNQARKDSSDLGAVYGYDYETVMSAGKSNISKAGFSTLENYKADMNTILQTSKAWGIDTSYMAEVSGNMAGMGIMKTGEQKKFADILAESIVQNGMKGRESEQLGVLETIADNLASKNSSVSENSLISSLNLYNSLIAQNKDLAGARGASMVSSMQELATSGNSTLDILAGWGTAYTGIEGKNRLRELAEQNPQEYYRKVWEGYKGRFGNDSHARESFIHMISRNGAGSVSNAREWLNTWEDSSTGKNDLTTTDNGQKAQQERIDNYNKDKVSTFEKKEIEKQEMKDDAGNVLNDFTAPLWDIYNSLPDMGKMIVGAAGSVGSMYGMSKLGGLAGGKLGSLLGNSSLGGTKVGGYLSKLLGSSSTSTSFLPKLGTSIGGLSKLTKAAPLVGAGIEAVSSGIDVYDSLKTKDYRNASRESGGGIGTIVGGLGGGSLGATIGAGIGVFFGGAGAIPGAAIGGAIGGLLGGVGGNEVGEGIGAGIYDLTSDKPTYSPDQNAKLQEFYNKVSEIYKSQGNDAAQDYTNNTVVPYLRSIGVSKSITDSYKWDIGKPDFMEDFEDGKFGSIVSDNSSELEENTEAIKDMTDAIKNGSVSPNTNNELTYKLQKDSGSNSIFDSVSSSVNNLFGLSTLSFDNIFKSHAVGNDYVPYNGYKASLHKGEMVLSKPDADNYRKVSPILKRVHSSNNKSWLDVWGNLISDTINSEGYKKFLDTDTSINSFEDAKKAISGIDITKISDYNKLSESDGLDVLRAKVQKIKQLSTNSAITPSIESPAKSPIPTGETKPAENNNVFGSNPADHILGGYGGRQNTDITVGNNKMELTIHVNGDISGMNKDNENMIVQSVVSQIQSAGLQRWLGNGFTRIPNR